MFASHIKVLGGQHVARGPNVAQARATCKVSSMGMVLSQMAWINDSTCYGAAVYTNRFCMSVSQCNSHFAQSKEG